MQTSCKTNDGVSLIVATLGEHDLSPLLDSLEKQTCKIYECIVIDQSDDKKAASIVSKYKNTKYIHSNRKGNSFNRNIGIDHAQMSILGFPDDDCYYSQDVVEKVLGVFKKRPEIAGVSGTWVDSITRNIVMRGSPNRNVTIFNSWTSVTNLTLFLSSDMVKKVHGYDEMFGLGSNVFEGGEETDLVIKVVENAGTIVYCPDIEIWHRQEHYVFSNIKKQLGYEESWGALFRKWFYMGNNKSQILLALLFLTFRSLLGALAWALRGNFKKAQLYMAKNAARFRGWNKYGILININKK